MIQFHLPLYLLFNQFIQLSHFLILVHLITSWLYISSIHHPLEGSIITDEGISYPKEAIHGDPTPVCEWCGKRVQLSRMWRQYGTYCSLECQAAGRPSYYLSLLSASIFTIIISGIIIGLQFIEGLLILACGVLCLFYSSSMYRLGSNIIKNQNPPLSKDELESLSTKILDSIQQNQTVNGVSRGKLIDDLESKGYSERKVKQGIELLLTEGKIIQIDLTHYKANS